MPNLLTLGGLISLPLAVLGQWCLDERATYGRTGGLVLALATLFFLGAFVRCSARVGRWPAWGVSDCGRPTGFWLAAAGAAGSLGSYAFFGGNRLSFLGILLWQGGLIFFIGGMLGWRLSSALSGLRSRLARARSIRLSPTWALLALATLVGALLRLWDIAALPAEPGVDLPLILLNVDKVLNGEWPIFFTLYPGREGLYIYVAAAFVRLFGLSYPALRTVSALLGIATIPVLYLVGRQLFNERAGLLATGLLAVSRWHIILSRTGLRFILMPLFGLLLVLVLDRALKGRRLLNWAAVGLVLGWGFHTYNSWLIMPAVVIGAWLLHRGVTRDWSRASLSGLLFALAIAALLLIPLLRFAHDDPEVFALRVATRLSGRERALPANVTEVLWTNLLRTIGMFNLTGDGVAHINVPLKRQLGLVSAALFLPGLAYLLAHWRSRATLLLALALTSVPSALALAFPEEVPNAGRSSGAIGLACLVAALPLVLWWQRLASLAACLKERQAAGRVANVVVAALLLAALTAEGVESRADYFQRYRFFQPGGNYAISTRLVEIIQEYSAKGGVYLKAFPHWYDGNALTTQLRLADIEWDNELTEIKVDQPPLSGARGPFLVLLHPLDNASLYILRGAFPRAVEFTRYDNHQAPAVIGFLVDSEQ